MRDSIITGLKLPESEADHQELVASGHPMHFKVCQACGQDFVGRTHSSAGWRDTQIVGWCETCYDELMGDLEEDDHGPD
jgi:hypothetical protein